MPLDRLRSLAHLTGMEDKQLDQSLIAAVFSQAALRGWADVNIAEAARDADLPLDRVRARFPGRGAVLLRFGIQADQAALSAGSNEPSPRERLFDMVMSRFDALQQNRAGILQLLRALRTDPATSFLLYGATLRSMKWLLDGASIPSSGIVGGLRVHGLLALWLYALRAWEGDESPDLSATMAAVDRGLDRAIQAENMLPGRSSPSPAEDAAAVFIDAGLVEDGSAPETPPDADPPPPKSDVPPL
jgi:ubiquinone biosynthesis protein COQ9